MTVSILDFDLRGPDWRAYDIASYLPVIRSSADESASEGAFLSGYEQICPSAPIERQYLFCWGSSDECRPLGERLPARLFRSISAATQREDENHRLIISPLTSDEITTVEEDTIPIKQTANLKVFISSHDSTCGALGRHTWITPDQDNGMLYLTCADPTYIFRQRLHQPRPAGLVYPL